MPVIKHFINRGMQKMLINEFLKNELKDSGYAGCDLQETQMGTRIKIHTSRPGLVIGKKGATVKAITTKVKDKFNINVPTIDIADIKIPELNASIQAERIAYSIEKGQHYRRVAYFILGKILRSGARGVEITISGKMVSQRARSQTFRQGSLSKCGTPAIEGVDCGLAEVSLKTGVLGIKVKIMREDYQVPDDLKIKQYALDEAVKASIVVEGEELDEELFEDIDDSEENILLVDDAELEEDIDELLSDEDEEKVEEKVEEESEEKEAEEE